LPPSSSPTPTTIDCRIGPSRGDDGVSGDRIARGDRGDPGNRVGCWAFHVDGLFPMMFLADNGGGDGVPIEPSPSCASESLDVFIDKLRCRQMGDALDDFGERLDDREADEIDTDESDPIRVVW